MTSFLQFDYALFYQINGEWTSGLLDALLPYWREKAFWIPLYVVLAGALVYRYRGQALYLLLLIGITITLSDQISSSVIKPAVGRLRPCREAALVEPARQLVTCGGGFSFPSSHAANHFALSVLLLLTWARTWGRWRWLLLLWATSVAYAQVYVGVHYPIDVTGGAILGTLIGWGMAALYRRWRGGRIDAFYEDTAEAGLVSSGA